MTKQRKGPWPLRPLIACLTLLAGCATLPAPQTPLEERIAEFESDALRRGSILVGAVRVMDYDATNVSREQLAEQIKTIQKKFVEKEIVPNEVRERSAEGRISLGSAANQSKEQNASANTPPKTSPDDAKSGPPAVEAVRLKLAVAQYLQSRIDDLIRLGNPPKHYHRLFLSVSITAWTGPDARSALVSLDLYPFRGDIFCHDAVDLFKREGQQKKQVLSSALTELFAEKVLNGEGKMGDEKFNKLAKMFLESQDRYGACHEWLGSEGLLPKLVYVEPIGDAYYFSEKSVVDASFALGWNNKFEASTALKDKLALDEITATTLAFAAGERRAGWLFLPRKNGDSIRPVERRVSMVVDVPDALRKIELHVHKVLLNNNAGLRADAAPPRGRAVRLLDELENEKDNYNSADWQLAKTRVRNSAAHFDQRLVLDIPQR